MAGPKGELMPKRNPFLFHENHEPFHCAKIGIEHDLNQAQQLTGPIPPIAAMDQAIIPFLGKTD